MIGQAVDKVKEALLEVTEEVSHYEASQKGCHYIVYADDGEGAGVHGDNQKLLQSIEGTIDLYTKKDRDPWVEGIQRALKRKRIAFRLSEISYEQETGYLHYQWIFETS